MMLGSRHYTMDQDHGSGLILYLDLALQVILTAVGLWPAIWLVQTFAGSGDASWKLALVILGATLTFVYGYFLALLVFRLVIPYTPEGYFPRGAGGKVPREVFIFRINSLLSKARYQPAWAEMFGTAIVNTFPLHQLYSHFFGPHRRGNLLGSAVRIPDPYLVSVGKGVSFGGLSMVLCHHYDQRGLFVKRVVVEDDVTVGGGAVIGPGVTIGKGAMIGAASFVRPNTRVGPYEYWAGDPARCIKKIKPQSGAGGTAQVTVRRTIAG